MAEVNNIVGVDYLKTPSGVCKFIEIVLCIAAPCLIGADFVGSAVNLLYSGTISGAVVAVFLLILRVFKIWKENGPKRYKNECVIAFIWTFYLIAAGAYIITASNGSEQFKPCINAGIIAICAGVVFFIDAVFNFFKDPICR